MDGSLVVKCSQVFDVMTVCLGKYLLYVKDFILYVRECSIPERMKRPWPEADTDNPAATSGNIGSFTTKGTLDAGLLQRNKDINVWSMHHFFGVIRSARFVPANCPNVLDERHQVSGRHVGTEAHMTLKTERI